MYKSAVLRVFLWKLSVERPSKSSVLSHLTSGWFEGVSMLSCNVTMSGGMYLNLLCFEITDLMGLFSVLVLYIFEILLSKAIIRGTT